MVSEAGFVDQHGAGRAGLFRVAVVGGYVRAGLRAATGVVTCGRFGPTRHRWIKH